MLKKIPVVLKTTFAKKKKKTITTTCSYSLFVSQLENPDHWKIVEGQFGEMLVGQDGDIMLEASTTSFWLTFPEIIAIILMTKFIVLLYS